MRSKAIYLQFLFYLIILLLFFK